MRVLLAGASGMIGGALAHQLIGQGHEVRRLVRRLPRRRDEIAWDPEAGHVPDEAIAWADGVCSLSGAPLTRVPWTPSYKKAILASRVSSTAAIAAAIARADSPPSVWVSGSAVGFYGDRPHEVLTERSVRGEGFLADVVEAWEAATSAATASCRVVHARTGVVIGRGGGALVPLLFLTRHGLGGTIGTGRQTWPWIALADEAAAIVHLLGRSELSGPVNLASPHAATAGDMTAGLAHALGKPDRLRLPVALARAVLGTAAEDLLLAHQHVVPAALTAEGTFQFALPKLDQAIAAALTTQEGRQ
jgi:uncharacterized protein (TIGR01777 family)